MDWIQVHMIPWKQSGLAIFTQYNINLYIINNNIDKHYKKPLTTL